MANKKYYYCPVIFPGDPIETTLSTFYIKTSLRNLRAKHHMTQKDVSDAIGISTQCISDMENIESGNPTLKSIIKYLDLFGYNLDIKKRL